uniref:type II toxin-antitoxin system TacA family antitoxin n=1 Tax=Burkholderia arboris TaxID=488730 RepID=UPI003BEF14C0
MSLAHPSRIPLNMRIRTDERALIDRAAAAIGKTRTDFILDAARAAAEQTLLDQVVLLAAPQAYAAFLARLDAPAQPNAALRRTMQTPPPWDSAA